MGKRVFKYPLLLMDVNFMQLPVGAEALTVQTQGDIPWLWALIDDEQPNETRKFAIVGTGHPAPEDGRYISTFQLHGGQLVFHVFEGPRP